MTIGFGAICRVSATSSSSKAGLENVDVCQAGLRLALVVDVMQRRAPRQVLSVVESVELDLQRYRQRQASLELQQELHGGAILFLVGVDFARIPRE